MPQLLQISRTKIFNHLKETTNVKKLYKQFPNSIEFILKIYLYFSCKHNLYFFFSSVTVSFVLGIPT